MAHEKTGVAVWIVGTIFGLLAALIHVYVPEQGLTFLWVMFAAMVLGLWKRERPWRWMALVVPFIPAADIVHKVLRPQQVSRPTMLVALLIVLASVPGAYGGSYMRLMIENIFDKKSE